MTTRSRQETYGSSNLPFRDNAEEEEELQMQETKKRRLTISTCLAKNGEEKWEEISFNEFRKATVEKYASLSFLGPSSAAVYWFRTYLKESPFDWQHCDSAALLKGEGRQERLQPQLKMTHFCHIPGQYLAGGKRTPNQVLSIGTPGVHFATSYMGIYNMIRKYGRFAARSRIDCSNEAGTQNYREKEIRISGYQGPPLPTMHRCGK